jgi:hypothetical protein
MQDSEKRTEPAPGEGGELTRARAEEEAAERALALKRAKAKKEIREWAVSIAVALIAVFLIRSFLFTVIRVDGDSMKETLHDGERLIITVLDVKLNGVSRDDVVICHYPGRTGFLGSRKTSSSA